MAIFSQDELNLFSQGVQPGSGKIGQTTTQAAPKKKGRGGFLTSLISEAGGTGGALGGAALGTALLPGIGTAVGAGLGAFLGGTSGRLAENKIRDDEFKVGEALKEGAISGVMGAGPIKLVKGAAGAVKGAAKGTGAVQGAQDAVSKSFLSNLTGRTGKRLTEAGSGLKADKNVGGVANLEDQASFMSRYTGTPRQQRVKMERDMTDLSKQVDDVLTQTPVRVDGALVGQRLKQATADLTDERFIDIDLTNPSVAKIIERYGERFAAQQDAKGINDLVKTLNKTATRAQEKLVNPTAGVLTAQEQAALALKRAGDDVLSQVPEIAPLKKQMAQIFEVTPQVARAGEKGLPVPFLQGLTLKAPLQAAKGVESRAGSALQRTNLPSTPGIPGFASRIFAGRVVDNATRPIDQGDTEVPPTGEPGFATLPESEVGAPIPEAYNPYAPENVETSIRKIVAQGGGQKDVQEYLANVKLFQELGGAGSGKRKTEAQVAREEAFGIAQDAIADLDKGSVVTGPVRAKIEDLKGILNAGDQETVDFNRKIGALRSAIIKARGGSAVTETELKIINEFVPKKGDSEQMIRSKLRYIEETFGKAAADYEPSTVDEITAGVGN